MREKRMREQRMRTENERTENERTEKWKNEQERHEKNELFLRSLNALSAFFSLLDYVFSLGSRGRRGMLRMKREFDTLRM
jgi:hypothetical protein